MFPRAGGQYHFLKEAYGPLLGLPLRLGRVPVIMSGGIATLAVGFGEYLGIVPPVLLHGERPARACRWAAWRWAANGGQLAGALAIALPDRGQLLRR